MMGDLKYLKLDSFELESGAQIQNFELAYQCFGTMNSSMDNIVWVFHALTANTDPFDWWPGLFGENDLFNPKEHFVICANTIGSPYGSTAPKDLSFPFFTVRDIVKAQLILANSLGISRIKLAIGGSFGGSQALEFAYSFEGSLEKLVLIACAARETSWAKAIHESQRMAMKADASFGKIGKGKEGIKAARAIGMLTYRTSSSFNEQQIDSIDKVEGYRASSYIQYQGEKFAKRFDSLAYYYLTQCMDSHSIGRNRGSETEALRSISSETMVIAIDTDVLLPKSLQMHIADHIPNAEYGEVSSKFGHDGFLIETKQLSQIITKFLKS